MKNLFILFLLCSSLSLIAQQAETLIQLGHSDRVSCVSITPDAALAATGSMDHTVKLWNMGTGQLIRTFNGHRGMVYDVQLGADGKQVYSCSWDDKRVLQWNALTGKIIKQYQNYNSPVSFITMSHDNKFLACCNSEGIIILRIADFTVQKKITVAKAKLAVFTSDDKQLIIATDDYEKEKILSYDFPACILSGSIPGISGPESISIANNKIVVSNYKEIAGIDILTKLKFIDIVKDSFRINTCCINKQGTQIAYGKEDGSIHVRTIDGNVLKDPNGAEIHYEKKHTGFINQLQFSEDGKFLITASNDWSAKVYSIGTGKVVRNLATRSEYIQSISISGNGNYLAFASGHLETGNHIGVWDLQKGKLFPFYPMEDEYNFFTNIAFSPRNKSIAAGNMNAKMSWVSFPNNGNSGNMAIGNAPVTCITFTPNGKNYIGGTKDGKLIFWRPDRNKSENIEVDHAGIASLSISPDGAKLVAGTYDGKVLLYDYETKTLIHKIESHTTKAGYYDTSFVMSYGASTGMSMDGKFAMTYASVMSVAVSADNSLVAACGGSWIKIFEMASGKLVRHIKQDGAGFCSINFSADGKYLCSGGADFMLRLYDLSNGAVIKTFVGHQNEVRTVLFSLNQKYLISGSLDTQIKIWEIATAKEILSYIVVKGGNDYVITNPQGYYFATKGAAKVLSFRIGNDVYPFEQFDLKYNRPDIILNDISKFAFADPGNNPNTPLIKSYYVAYQKRLKRLGFNESQLGSTFHTPGITINSADLPLSTKQTVLNFDIKAEDNLYNLKSINVWVNDVPLYGAAGKSINGKTAITHCSVPLGNERNKISISCTNEKGAESYKESFEIIYEGGVVNYKTYFIGIGISNYQDASFNLKYAEKDIKDLAKIAAQKNAEIILLTNENATKENILKLKERLLQTSVNDKIIISLSGHGLLSKDLDFYYATYDTDFRHPEKKGLLYEDLESLLDGIPARNKLLLVDACHSGEVDKDINIQVAETKPEQGVSGISARGSALIIDSSSIGLENSFELMQDVFSDISNGNGAIIISAAGGMEYALESAQWNNGVFTYCVLNALQNGVADTNTDKKISVEELKNYVSTQVQTLTGGRQKPTSRKENLENNWTLW